MSGGVDSAVAAYLLKCDGYDVHGIFMRTWNAEDDSAPVSDCPWKRDMDDASDVCDKIGITFEVVNMISNYRELVVKELVDGYKSGITPNPDVMCNMKIKFGVLKKYAESQGFDMFATGHYARCLKNSDGSVDIFEGIDKNKDQSYFLAMLSQEQVRNVIFPVGNLTKPDVREIAKSAGLPNCKKKDSQGICFLGKVKIQDFLSHYIQDNPGEIVTTCGDVIGHHNGLFRFTIGQRHGINLPSNRDFAHYVVVGKDLIKNQLIVEIETEKSEHLYKSGFFVHSIKFINAPIKNDTLLLGRARYRDPSCKIRFKWVSNECERAYVEFETPQRAIASGQVMAFYENEKLLGGGIFE